MSKRQTADFSLKIMSIDDETGTFEGYASIFNNVDLAGDMVLPGAFARTLHNKLNSGKFFPLLWQHDTFEPIGMVTSAVEDMKGLKFTGQLIMESDDARQKYALLKAGAISGVSIGYDAVGKVYPEDLVVDGKKCVRQLKEIKLWELSLVTFPCNEEATVTDVKGISDLSDSVDAMTESLAALMAKLTEVNNTFLETNTALANSAALANKIPEPVAQPAPDENKPDGDTPPPADVDGTPDPAPAPGDAEPNVPDADADEMNLDGCSLADLLALQAITDATTSATAEFASMVRSG